jgi:hypothetical protein
MTKFELDMRIPMTNLHMQFESYTCIQTKVRERKLRISFFSKFKRGNSVKNQWTITKFEHDLRIPMMKFISRGITLSKNHPTMTKFELDLHNPMMYQYTKFELNVCNRSRDNERKPVME